MAEDRKEVKEATSMLTAASALTSLHVGSSGGNDMAQDSVAKHERPAEDAPDGCDADRAKRRKTEVKESKSSSVEEDVPVSFPQKLMEVLADEDNSDIISWLPHGRSFMIYQKKRFATEVMPKHFKQSKFTSFTRKLNRWGFTRISRGPETGSYFHPYFQKGNLRLCSQMTCHTIRPTLAQQRAELLAGPPFCMSNAMAGLCLSQNQPLMPQQPQNTVNNSLLRLRQLQQQQEQLLLQQQEIKQQMEAFAKSLPQDILTKQNTESMSGKDGLLSATPTQHQMQASQPQNASFSLRQGPLQAQNMPNASAAAQGTSTDQAYTQAIINAAVDVLQRSNTNQYLAMLVSQGKALSTGSPSPSTANPVDFQQQLRQTVHAQLEQLRLYNQQRAAAATSTTMNQQGQVAQILARPVSPAKLQPQQNPIRRQSGPVQRKGAKRASAA